MKRKIKKEKKMNLDQGNLLKLKFACAIISNDLGLFRDACKESKVDGIGDYFDWLE